VGKKAAIQLESLPPHGIVSYNVPGSAAAIEAGSF
jgi:hypothetical protein